MTLLVNDNYRKIIESWMDSLTMPVREEADVIKYAGGMYIRDEFFIRDKEVTDNALEQLMMNWWTQLKYKLGPTRWIHYRITEQPDMVIIRIWYLE